MPRQRASLAASARKTAEPLPESAFLSHVQTLQPVDEEQAQRYCSSGMDPPGNTRREQPEVKAQTVVMHPQHIRQAEFH